MLRNPLAKSMASQIYTYLKIRDSLLSNLDCAPGHVIYLISFGMVLLI